MGRTVSDVSCSVARCAQERLRRRIGSMVSMISTCSRCMTQASILILRVVAVIGGNSILKRLRLHRKLGAGCYGAVFEVRDTADETAQTMACKEIRRTKDGIIDFKQVND